MKTWSLILSFTNRVNELQSRSIDIAENRIREITIPNYVYTYMQQTYMKCSLARSL